MLNMERLLKPIAIKALTSRAYNFVLQEMLYTLPNKNLLSVKHAIEIISGWKKLMWPNKATHVSTHEQSLHHDINLQEEHPKEAPIGTFIISWHFSSSWLHLWPSHELRCCYLKERISVISSSYKKNNANMRNPNMVLSFSPWQQAWH